MNDSDPEVIRLRAALAQVTDLHDKLVEELRVQYSRARSIGWLPPHIGPKIARTIQRTKKTTVIDENGVVETPLDTKQAIEKIAGILAKEDKRRAEIIAGDADETERP